MPLHVQCEARGEGHPHLRTPMRVGQVTRPPALCSQCLSSPSQKGGLPLHKVYA